MWVHPLTSKIFKVTLFNLHPGVSSEDAPTVVFGHRTPFEGPFVPVDPARVRGWYWHALETTVFQPTGTWEPRSKHTTAHITFSPPSPGVLSTGAISGCHRARVFAFHGWLRVDTTIRFSCSWEAFIGSLMKEWEDNSLPSSLYLLRKWFLPWTKLVSFIITLGYYSQITEALDDPVNFLLSMTCALMRLFICILWNLVWWENMFHAGRAWGE